MNKQEAPYHRPVLN